ncbi:DUF3304 domain-containing protein [Aquabacterium sp.]|uniref:DUF3304 domain-containing protein n=1 Tax=Aquabacterium sp. TaxID=1872578 RepID=UPI0035B2E4C5
MAFKMRMLAVTLICVWILGSAQAEEPSEMVPSVRRGETQALLIQGYNYTDDVIDSFTVNGQGGGRLYVSGPDSGGGGSVCCVSYRPGTPLPIKLRVRWMGGYCIERVKNPYPYGKPYYDNRRGLWREADAFAVDLSNRKPRALEVHIFPDGHVEASITEGDSDPRLSLPRTVNFERPGVQHTYPNCTDDQLKQSKW